LSYDEALNILPRDDLDAGKGRFRLPPLQHFRHAFMRWPSETFPRPVAPAFGR
jgi:hypothetical protein